MNISNRPRYIVALLLLSIVLVVSAYGQNWSGQPRIPANSSGLKEQIEALALRVTALEAENAILKAGQLNLLSWEHTQLAAQIIEVQQWPDGRMIWVCDLDDPAGERQATRDEFLDGPNDTDGVRAVRDAMEAQMVLLQP